MTILCLAFFKPVLAFIALLAVIISSVGLGIVEMQSRKNAPTRQESINEMADEIVQYVRGMAIQQ